MFGIYNINSINSECETGKYGINCSKSCGNCHNQSLCQNVDGSCSDGCSAGYKESLCTERKYNFISFLYHLTVLNLLLKMRAFSFSLHVFDTA